ncbi:MAG: hypothetical protein H2172_11065 [Opitutus sp.]|nr:hypothetical protein [Opitutus sp.]MCS6247981.1 hypothetical protein [Opitutus sp.]MCS6276889.1 hypothetical protein [Opitutus sp.]MCS6301462.1 hypothetical protein [Opitutus sp.]
MSTALNPQENPADRANLPPDSTDHASIEDCISAENQLVIRGIGRLKKLDAGVRFWPVKVKIVLKFKGGGPMVVATVELAQ